MSLQRINQPVIADGQPMRLVSIPASAGFPSPAADDLEDEIDPIAWMVRRPTSTFWWRVSGSSLNDLGILDGDLIAVDRDGKRRVGRAVVAVVDGAPVAKILRKRDGRYYLASANTIEGYPDIELTPDSEIWGVIAGVVRRYDLE